MQKFEKHGVIVNVKEPSDNAPIPLAVMDVQFSGAGKRPSNAVAESPDQLRDIGDMFHEVADLIEESDEEIEHDHWGAVPRITDPDEDEWPKTWNEVRGIEGGDIVRAEDSWDEFGSAMRVYNDVLYVRAGVGYEGGRVRNAWLPFDAYLREVVGGFGN